MYVEVGGRQTGKTTRLIDNVVRFLTENDDKSVLIVAPNHASRQLISEKVGNTCGHCIHRVITSHKMLPPRSNSTLKQFVDEFGAVKDDNLVVDPEAYYCSSYYPDFDPRTNPTQSMDGYSTKAMEIIDYYYNWNTVDRWDMGPKKKIFKHDF